jgi:hypothetical protein
MLQNDPLRLPFHFDAYPDPDFYSDADPNFQFDADPDPDPTTNFFPDLDSPK